MIFQNCNEQSNEIIDIYKVVTAESCIEIDAISVHNS